MNLTGQFLISMPSLQDERFQKTVIYMCAHSKDGAMGKENKSQKGDVLNTSRLAGIMASKKTSELIPLCHQINLDKVSIDYDFCNDEKCIIIKSTAVTSGKTGVEMEALMGATLASLTIYDMLKAVDKKIMITDIMLDYKDGGRSGKFVRD